MVEKKKKQEMGNKYRVTFDSHLTFSEWLNREYGNNCPDTDEDSSIWYQYIEYIKGPGEK